MCLGYCESINIHVGANFHGFHCSLKPLEWESSKIELLHWFVTSISWSHKLKNPRINAFCRNHCTNIGVHWQMYYHSITYNKGCLTWLFFSILLEKEQEFCCWIYFHIDNRLKKHHTPSPNEPDCQFSLFYEAHGSLRNKPSAIWRALHPLTVFALRWVIFK